MTNISSKRVEEKAKQICEKVRYYATSNQYPEESEEAKAYLEVVSFFPSNAKYMKKFPVIWERDNPEGLPTLWDREDGVNPPS